MFGLSASLSDKRYMQERRTEKRLLCAELVEIVWTEQTGRQRRRVANLEDISPSGACIQVETPIICGTQVTIRCGDSDLTGTVRYCLYRTFGYFLGIHFEDGCRWSRKFFRPGHLLDPRQVAEKAARRSASGAPINNSRPHLPSPLSIEPGRK